MPGATTEDDGAPDPGLVAALVTGDPTAIAAELLVSRVLVPIVATGEESSSAEMAVPGLVGADGRVGLPVFSGTASLSGWRADARPVPMTGAQAVVAALGEGYAALVLDVAGPVSHVLDSERLAILGTAAQALVERATGRVTVAPE